MKSKYAEYFDIQPRILDGQENQAVCLTCGDVLRMPNRSTSALKYHIETKHGINLDDQTVAKSESDDIILEPSTNTLENFDEDETSYNDTEDSMSSRKPIRKSKYAEYFDIQPKENQATCLTCQAVLNMTNRNTSTLKYHIETKHGIDIEESAIKSESDEIILEPKSEDHHDETTSYDDDVDFKNNKSYKISKKSKYSEYFDIQPEENRATCLTCEAVLNMPNRSTSALKYHIEIKHDIILEDTKVEIETIGEIGKPYFLLLYIEIYRKTGENKLICNGFIICYED